MFRKILLSVVLVSCVVTYANAESKCEFKQHDLSPFLEGREGLERSFVKAAHDLMMAYCLDQKAGESLKNVLLENGVKNKNTGIRVLLNSVNIVGPFYRGRADVDNKEIFSGLYKFYEEKQKAATTEKQRVNLVNSFNLTSKATVEIINYFVATR